MKFVRNISYYSLYFFVFTITYIYGDTVSNVTDCVASVAYNDSSACFCGDILTHTLEGEEFVIDEEGKEDKIVSSFFNERIISTDFFYDHLNIKGNNTNILSCIKYDNDSSWYYGGNLRIPVSMNLKTEEEAFDEATFAANLQMHLDESEKNYKNLPDSLNGKIISTDIACHLYEPYAMDDEGRLRFLFSTRMPAAWFMNYLYYKRLAEIVVAKKKHQKIKKPNVVFLAGGDGSGKTSAVKHLNLPIIENADIIRDATMGSGSEFHRKVIEKALEVGVNVTIIYVFRPIESALDANIIRAQQIGRVRPLNEIANAHYTAQQNILEFSEYFGNRIQLLVIDNSRTFKEISLVENPIEFLRSSEVYYHSRDEVLDRALLAYANKNKEEIPVMIRNLLESQLDESDLYKNTHSSELEKERWFHYLREVFILIAARVGFPSV